MPGPIHPSQVPSERDERADRTDEEDADAKDLEALDDELERFFEGHWGAHREGSVGARPSVHVPPTMPFDRPGGRSDT